MLAVIDDETARLLQQLRRWAPGDDVQFDDFMSLAVVMGLQRNRTPQARRFIASMSDWSTRRAGEAAQEFTTNYYVDLLFSSVFGAADQLSTRQLELWDDPQGRFITCDQPVLFSQGGPGAPPPSMDTSRHVWWPISPSRLIVLSLDPQGHKVLHRVARPKDVDEVRSTFVRGAESAIIALPEDRDLPSGKRLRRRPQVQVDCEPVDAKARKCRIHFGWGYGNETLDRTCRPLCAMAGTSPGDVDARPARTTAYPPEKPSAGTRHAGRVAAARPVADMGITPSSTPPSHGPHTPKRTGPPTSPQGRRRSSSHPPEPLRSATRDDHE